MNCEEALKEIQKEVDDWNSGKTMFTDPRPDDDPRLWNWANLIDRLGRLAQEGLERN